MFLFSEPAAPSKLKPGLITDSYMTSMTWSADTSTPCECQRKSISMTLAFSVAGHRLGIEGTGVQAKSGRLGVRVMRCMDG